MYDSGGRHCKRILVLQLTISTVFRLPFPSAEL